MAARRPDLIHCATVPLSSFRKAAASSLVKTSSSIDALLRPLAGPLMIYAILESEKTNLKRLNSGCGKQIQLTETGAEQAVNSFLSKIDGGTKMTDGSWTNTVAALGNTSLGGAVSGVASSIVGLVGKLSGTFGL